MALGRVQDAVKQAFRGVHDEVIPLHMMNDGNAWERAQRTTKPFENELLTVLMHDTFKVADALNRDMANI